MSTPAPIETLIQSARRGDESALTELFGRYQNYLRLLAAGQLRARLRVRASESDVVQETLLRATQEFGKFRGNAGGEFVVWLRTILHSRLQHLVEQHVLAQRRDVRREVAIAAGDNALEQSTRRLASVLVDRHPAPPQQVAAAESAVAVAEALSALPPDYREVLMLRSVEGLAFADVADIMGRSSGAVRMLWLRAIERLRDQFGAET